MKLLSSSPYLLSIFLLLFGVLSSSSSSKAVTETKIARINNAQVNDLPSQNSNNRILQSDGGVGLETKWRVDKPTFAYDALNFELVYTISDFVKIGNSRYTVFDGHQCQEGDKDITTTQQYLTSTVVEDDITPVGDGSGLRTIKVSLTIHPDQITTSPIYEESESTHQGFVYFCVRFGVWQTSDFNAFEPLEVNFIETPVLLIVDLVDDIAIEASTLTDADKIVESAQKGSAVNGYICDSEDNLVTQTTTSKTQGSSVKVCVEPTTKTQEEGAYLRYIESFTFVRVNTTQVAIEPGTNGVAANELTVVNCTAGSTLCSFETLLGAEFFDSPGLVRGDGLAFLQLGQTDYLNLNGGGGGGGDAAEAPADGAGSRRRARVSDLGAALDSPTRFRFEIFVIPAEGDDESSGNKYNMIGLTTATITSFLMVLISTMVA